MIDLVATLEGERQPILEAAAAGLARMHAPHYEAAGADEVKERIAALFDRLLESITARDLGPIEAYGRQIAEERFTSGYALSEVQVAFNALEEATWAHVLQTLEPSQLAEALGLVTTVLGAGKDALARAYVSLAAGTHAPSLDLRALFAGTS